MIYNLGNLEHRYGPREENKQRKDTHYFPNSYEDICYWSAAPGFIFDYETRCRNALWCNNRSILISSWRRNVPFLLFTVYLFDVYTFPYEGGYVCGQFCEQLVQVEE